MRKVLFRAAKSPLMGKTVGLAFQHCSWAIPVKRMYASKEVIAFAHPQPAYRNHAIITPKRAVRNLQQMAQEGYNGYLEKIWAAAMALRAARPEYSSFTLVANGGKRQEVQQVHFHMFTDHPMARESGAVQEGKRIYTDGSVCVMAHAAPEWECHLVVKPVTGAKTEYFKSVLRCIDRLDVEFQIVQRGYSLVHQHNGQPENGELPVFHIVSGKRIG